MDAVRTGSFISSLRKEGGLTQQQLAARLHVSDKAVSRWETGRGMPDIANLEGLATALDTSIAELLKGERIVEATAPQDVDALTTSSLSLARAALRRALPRTLAAGFFLGLAVVVLVVVHLTSPQMILDPDDALAIESLSDGRLVAVLDEDVAGWQAERVIDPESGDTSLHLSCYQTTWHRLFGPSDTDAQLVLLGNADEFDWVYYYPTLGDDELLVARDPTIEAPHVRTLPRLVYNMWIALGAVVSVAGLVAAYLLRRRWFALRALRLALLPSCLTVAAVAVLWGAFGRVYDAPFYLSGILLVALALYAGALVLIELRAKPPVGTGSQG